MVIGMADQPPISNCFLWDREPSTLLESNYFCISGSLGYNCLKIKRDYRVDLQVKQEDSMRYSSPSGKSDYFTHHLFNSGKKTHTCKEVALRLCGI